MVPSNTKAKNLLSVSDDTGWDFLDLALLTFGAREFFGGSGGGGESDEHGHRVQTFNYKINK